MSAFVYNLRHSDGSTYVGSARGETLDERLGEHQAGTSAGHMSRHHPVTLAYAEQFQSVADAVAAERRLGG